MEFHRKAEDKFLPNWSLFKLTGEVIFMRLKVISRNMELVIVSPALTHLSKMGVQKENIDTS